MHHDAKFHGQCIAAQIVNLVDQPEVVSRECTLRLTAANTGHIAGVFFKRGG